MALRIWLLLALAGVIAGVVTLLLLRVRLQAHHNQRPRWDGWHRGRLSLFGYSASVLLLGIGLGGSAASWLQSPWTPRLLGSAPQPPLEGPDRSLNAAWYSVSPPRAADTDARPTADDDAPVRAAGREEAPSGGVAVPTASDDGTSREAESVATPPRSGTPPAVAESSPARVAERAAEPAPTPTVSAASAAPTATFGVRVGVFREAANADQEMARLRRDGFSPLVQRRSNNSGEPVYYVYAGAYATRSEARDAVTRIKNAGGDAVVVNLDPTEGRGSE